MGYYKFSQDEIFHNRVETYPKNSFFIYQGQRYYNNETPVTGAFNANVGHTPNGWLSLYGLNAVSYTHLTLPTKRIV